MPAPIRNFAVAQGQVTTTGGHTIYGVPANHALILKFVPVRNGAAIDDNVTVTLYPAVDGAAPINLVSTPLTPGQTFIWSGWTVLNASDIIAIFNGQQPTNFWCAGALLPYVAPIAVTGTTTQAADQQPPPPVSTIEIPIPSPPTIY